MPLTDYQFDRLSFWLGFVIATFFWWLLTVIRPLLPRLRDQIRQAIKAYRQRNLAGAEAYLLRETIRRAQRAHLAAPLFSLDEILVEPRLIAPPSFGEADSKEFNAVPISAQVLPYLPDWPELTTPLGAPTMSVVEATRHGSPIAIIGQPGSGKTVALAQLAAQLAAQSPALTPDSPLEEGQPEARKLPLYLHIHDLDTTLSQESDPLDNLRSAVIRMASLVAQPQITRFLQTVFDSRMSEQWQPILLLDGLDELPHEELLAASRYLRALLRQRPAMKAVVTASSDHVDGLTRAGFVPLALACWNNSQREQFIERWGDLWVNQFLPEIQKQVPDPGIDPMLINNWLRSDLNNESPFELTLKTWAAYAGDLNGPGTQPLLETFINRHLAATYRAPVNSLARQMLIQNKSSIDFDTMEELLSSLTTSGPFTELPLGLETEPAAARKPDDTPKKTKGQNRLGKEAAIVSPGERIISVLLNGGLLYRHQSGKMRFASPILAGYLAGPHLSPDEAAALAEHLEWSTGAQALRFQAACGPQVAWLVPVIKGSSAPFHRGLLAAARWLPDVPASAEWRSSLMRQLVTLLQNETLPFGARARFAAAFVASRDASSLKLFRQLLTARSPVIRRIAAIACGALGQPAAKADLLELLADPDPSVRKTACVALGCLPGEAPLNLVGEILMQSDEDLRQIAAETLALRPKDGYSLLEKAAQSSDLLARRAAVSGLLQIRESWVRERIERISVEDSQWIVRNAAAQALEVYDKPTPLIPHPLLPPSECPWLINFAGRLGMGIAPDRPATDVLLSALKTGSFDEQVGALEYLRYDSSEGVIRQVYEAVYCDQPELQEAALYALWWMALSGVKLPDPMQYGMG